MSIKELKLKYFCKVKDGTHDTPQYVDGTDDTFPLVTSKDITNGNLSFNNAKHISYEDYLAINRRSNVEKYDVIMPMIGTVGNPAIVMTDKPFSIKNVALFKTSPNIAKSKYLKYMLDSSYIKEQFNLNSRGGVQSFVSLSVLENLKILMPENLDNVICYLDKKTNKVDALINNKLKLINLLEQQRQSIITEAVTKGLNPNVKMKDSGVEWIGEIPEHWEEKKIKYLFYEANERNFNEDATLLSLFTSIGVKPRKEMEQKGNKAQTVINYKIVRKKDIVVNKLLAWMGAIGLSEYNGVTSPDYDVYRPLNTEKVEELYYHYYFRNHYFKGDCFKFGRGIMMMRWRTYPEQLKSILAPVPPKEEQIQIANYIEYKEKELAQTIKNIEKSIEKLKEYRQALIYEAVTGKIDVRDMELD